MNGNMSINARTLGFNRETILAAIHWLQPAFTLLQNDPEAVTQAAALGTRVIYRQSGDETLDVLPAAFIGSRHLNAKSAAYLHTFNERQLTPALAIKEIECMQVAEDLGRKCCIINASTNQSRADWDNMRPAIARAVEKGHAIGVHVYLDGKHDDGAWDWLPLRQEFGGLWIFTEVAWIKSIFNPYVGHRGNLPEIEAANWFANFAINTESLNMPIMAFSFDDWPTDKPETGFGFWRSQIILNVMRTINWSIQWKDYMAYTPGYYTLTGYPQITLPDGYVNMRSSSAGTSQIVGKLKKDDRVEILEEKLGWVKVSFESTTGWVSLQQGRVEFTKVALDEPLWKTEVRALAVRLHQEADRLEELLL